ncbi:MAG: hypothetical protein WC936_06870 [Candidatus Nanoarchaeia archaeon]|jgi:hypothetical protein
MVVRWVIARGDGRGGLRIPAAHSRDFAGERLDIGGRSVGITTDGRANISRKIMEEYGTLLPDGRYALAVDVGYRYTDEKLRIGGYINQGAVAPDGVQTGDTISYAHVFDTGVISPTTDGTEYYTAGD